MGKFTIYLHGENNPSAKVIEIDEEATVNDIIIKHHEVFSILETTEEFEIFVEDEIDIKVKEHHHEKAGIHKHSQVHCHRCKDIKIDLEYNGQTKFITVSPSTTGAKLLSEIPTVFPITEADAMELILELSDKKHIEKTDHLGSFVSYPLCKILIKLRSKTNIQG